MSINLCYAVCLSILFCVVQVFGSELKAGDSCKLKSGATGLCKYLTDCAPALDVIKKGGFPEEKCDSEGTQFIVCCEDTSTVTKSPPTSKPDVPKEIPSPKIVTTVASSNRKTGEISKTKCKEYAQYVWDRSQLPTLTIVPRFANTSECPFDRLPLIVGGQLASREEFPHMVLIGYTKGQEVDWSCGGSLISENYVLTASHCLKHSRLGLAKLIRVGLTNQSDTINMQERIISEIRYHPEYQASSKYHDIALLKLSENVSPNIYARPACLQVKKEIEYKRAIATGWGDIGFIKEASNDLLRVVLEFFDNQSCNHTYRKKINRKETQIGQGILEDLMICAGSSTEIKDTCQGDSGGPLQVYHDPSDGAECMYNIVGVTSFGQACGLAKNAPGVYTRVSTYVKWIEDIVWPE